MTEDIAPYGRRALRAEGSVRFKAYSIIERAVEEGAECGFRRAHKHTDRPEKQSVIEHITQAIMLALDEVVDFGES